MACGWVALAFRACLGKPRDPGPSTAALGWASELKWKTFLPDRYFLSILPWSLVVSNRMLALNRLQGYEVYARQVCGTKYRKKQIEEGARFYMTGQVV